MTPVAINGVIPKFGRTATKVVAAADSLLTSKLQADYVCDGLNDEVELAAAYATGKVVVWAEGTFHFGASLTIPQYSTTIFNNVKIEGEAVGYCITVSSDTEFKGRILEYDANATALALFYVNAKDNVDLNCAIDKFTAISGRAIYITGGGNNVKVRGVMTVVDPTGKVVQSGQMPTNFLVENIHASITASLLSEVIYLLDASGSSPHDITIRNLFFDGNNIAQTADFCPFNIVCSHGKPWGKRLTIENINVINRDGDPLNIMHWNGVTARHLHATGSSASTGAAGAAWQFNSVRNLEWEDVTHNGSAQCAIHFDQAWGSNRFVKGKSATLIDSGKVVPYPALLIGRGSTDALANHYVDACILNDADVGYTDYTAEAREATANDVPLMPAAPAQDDWIMFGLKDPPGAPIALNLVVGTVGAGVYTLVWEYRADDGTWKALPNFAEVDGATVTSFNYLGAGWYLYLWNLPEDFNTTYDETVGATTYTCHWIRARISAFTNMTIRPLGNRAYLFCGNQDFDLDFIDAHQESGVTQTYGIEVSGMVRRVNIGNNCKLLDNQTAPMNVVADIKDGSAAYQTVQGFSGGIKIKSVEMDLSNAAEDFVTFLATNDSGLVAYEVQWTEAAGDANTCNIRIGKITVSTSGTAGVLDDDYYDIWTTAGSELLNRIDRFRNADLLLYKIAKGEALTVGHTQKTGGGNVIITLFIMEGCR